MLKQFNTTFRPKQQLASSEYSRLLSAAVINHQFRQMLISNPIEAISHGYSGEHFDIDGEEKKRISTIQATSLADFASQLSQV